MYKRQAIGSERDPIEKLIDRIVGRVAAEDVVNPLTGEVIVPCNEMISYDTVSYTHLDVYKRQNQNNFAKMNRKVLTGL